MGALLTKKRDSVGRFVKNDTRITAAVSWTLVGAVNVGNARGFMGVEVDVLVAAITNFKVTRSMQEGGHDAGTQLDFLVDTDFNTPTVLMPNCSPTSPHLTTAGNRFQFLLECLGVAEFGFWVKSAGTATVAARANFPQDFNQ